MHIPLTERYGLVESQQFCAFLTKEWYVFEVFYLKESKNLHLQKILGLNFFVNAIVEFGEWSIASIIRVGRSRRGVKTFLWITE